MPVGTAAARGDTAPGAGLRPAWNSAALWNWDTSRPEPAPYSPGSGPADSQIRERARRTRGIAWTDDLAGALAVARRRPSWGSQDPRCARGRGGSPWRGRPLNTPEPAVRAMPGPSRRATGAARRAPAHGGGGGSSRAVSDTPRRGALGGAPTAPAVGAAGRCLGIQP